MNQEEAVLEEEAHYEEGSTDNPEIQDGDMPKIKINSKMPSIDRIKELFESKGYYAEESLLWDTYLNINKIIEGGLVGQEIQAICLEGPPGAGKTLYAKIYAQILHEILNEEVDMVQYQCDATTGKAELYEEIKISAAITGDANDVLIPGKLVEAIDDVNAGKNVILFLDEYDKAKEETDAFLLSFLQDGRINTTQRGELQVANDKYKHLQVILCKNDMREELSGPLERRVKIIKLDNITPKNFAKVSERALPDVNHDLKELISIYYDLLYGHREDFNRIPSCAELLIAIQEADILIDAGAPQEKVHQTILSTLLKNKNDFETFEAILKKSIQEMKKTNSPEKDHLTKIFSNLFEDELKKEILGLQKDINDLQKKAADLEEKNEKLQSKLTNAQNDRVEMKDKNDSYKAEIDTLKRNLADLQKEKAKMQDEINNLQNKLAKALDEISSLKVERDALKTENASLKAENTKLKDDNKSLQTENDELRDKALSQLVTPTYIQVDTNGEKLDITDDMQFMKNSSNHSMQQEDLTEKNWYRLGCIESKKSVDINELINEQSNCYKLNSGVVVYEDDSFVMYVETSRRPGQDKVIYNFLSNRPVVTLEMVEQMLKTLENLGINASDRRTNELKVSCLVAKGFDTKEEEVMPKVMHLQAESLDELTRNGEFKRYTEITNHMRNLCNENSVYVSVEGSQLHEDESSSFLSLFDSVGNDGHGNRKLSLYDHKNRVVIKNFREVTQEEEQVLRTVFEGDHHVFMPFSGTGVISAIPLDEWKRRSIVKGSVTIDRGPIDSSYIATVEKRGKTYRLTCLDFLERFDKIKKNNYNRAVEAGDRIASKAAATKDVTNNKIITKTNDISAPEESNTEDDISLINF